MIHSFEEKNLEKLFTSGKSQSGLPTDITNSLKRALNELHAAGSEADLIGTVAKLAMRQPFVLFKGLTFQNSAYQAHFAQGITIIKC